MDEREPFQTESINGTPSDGPSPFTGATFKYDNAPDGEIKGPREHSASFTARLTPEGMDAIRQTFGVCPSECPHCGWKHPSEMFRLVDDRYECMKCGGEVAMLPAKSDEWADLIDG